MKRFLYLLLSSIFLMGFIVGCSSEEEGESSGDTETTEESSSSKVTLSKQREILGKAAKDFDKLDGITFKNILTTTVEMNEVKQTNSIDLNVDLSISPYKYHGKGKLNALGIEVPIEVYADDSYTYLYQDNEWAKGKTEEKEYDFANDLTQLQDFLQKDKNADWASVTKQGSVYSYDLNLDKSTNNDIKDEIKAKVKEYLNNAGLVVSFEEIDPDISVDKLDLRIEKYNVKLEIQDKEPKLKKYTIETDVLAPVGSKLLKINMKKEIDVKGKYDKRIDIPEEATKASEVKN